MLLQQSSYSHIRSLTLMLSTLSLALAATLPSPSTSPSTNDTTPHRLLKSKVNCLTTIPFSPFYLTMHGCANAIQEISNSQTLGTFHMGDPFDEWSLPITKTSGFCKVTVEMATLWDTDDSSWLQINLALTQLNLQCASRYGYRYKGGFSSTGNRGGINVRLDRYSPVLAKENQTEVEELQFLNNA